jgi:non-ribosomal peptide synthetase component F
MLRIGHRTVIGFSSDGEVVGLFIEDPNLAIGYLHDVAKTAATFMEGATWQNLGQWFFKIGSLERRNADGTLDFVCRKDKQIKVHRQGV